MISRRKFSQAAVAAAAVAVVGGSTAQAAIAPVTGKHPTLGPIKQVDAGFLNIGYAEAGPADGPPVILLHGWPYDIHSYVDVAPMLASAGYRVIVPFLRGYGTTRFLSADTVRNGQQAATASDVIALMDALKIKKAVLGGFDWGSRTAGAVAAIWPERVTALVAVSGYLITNLEMNLQPLDPAAELGWWYQYYFATERGVLGYAKNWYEFDKLIWKIASPKWNFSEKTYARSAAAFDNPDHVDVVIHNYRWRQSLAPGEAKYAELEAKLQKAPVISVPTITIASDFDGAAADGAGYRKQFTGKYAHRILRGIGHNVPQEAPREFAKSIVDVSHFS